jgi:hypothetical protein
LQDSIKAEEPDIIAKLKDIHDRTPSAAPRDDKRRYMSFDATDTTKEDDSAVNHHEMISEIESLKLSNLAGMY